MTDPAASADVFEGDPNLPVGLTLQRGGEELILAKVGDRFTLRLRQPGELEAVINAIQPETYRLIPASELVEVEVEPAQLDASMTAARSLPAVRFASHVYELVASPNSRLYLGDELTVQFSAPATPAQRSQLAADFGLESIETVSGEDSIEVFRVTTRATENPIKLANRLMALPWVLLAEPNITIQTQAWYRPQDSLYPQQWYLQHQGGEALQPNIHIAAEAAWDITRGDRSVVVAVIDDGFDLEHPDLQGMGKIVAPYDWRDYDPLPLPEQSTENHGTAVAGVAIATENGQGIVGVAPGCAFMPIRSLGSVDDRAIEQMFDWAIDHGAAVICCSWGAGAIYFPLSLRQRRAINRAATMGRAGKGCVVVFAAGNANRPLNGTITETGWPKTALKGSQRWLNGFAVHPDVIAVAACTSLGTKAAYSNWGAEVDIAAPSNNAPPNTWLPTTGSIQTGPVIRQPLPGRGILTSDRLGAAGYDPTGFTQQFGGTSSACPVVAGVAALMLSANPDLTATEVKTILQQTADKVIDPNPDPQLQLKKGTYNAQGHSDWFGAGKVNAARAVSAAQQRRSRPQRQGTVLQRFNDQAIAIPDGDPTGVRSSISIPEAGQLKFIEITVDIRHDFLGDLEITLIPPQAPPLLLQGRTLGNQQQLIHTYAIATTPALSRLLNTSITGNWQLGMVDRSPTDTGQLRRWQLTLTI